MAFDMVLQGGEVALPGREPAPMKVAVKGGKVAAILAPDAPVEAAETIDVGGKLVLPGILDVHLHLGHGNDISRPRVPEDAATETAAAAAGGVTTMIPYLMSSERFEDIFEEVRAVTEAGSRIDFGYHFIISTEDQLAAVPRYIADYGAPSFKIFMNNRGGEGKRLGLPDIDDGFLMRLCQLSAEHGGMVCPHPENIELAWLMRDRLMQRDPEGKGGLRSWNESRPPLAEAEAIQRVALFARAAGARLYVVHTSSALALEAARAARAQGTDITIESCPHYLTHDVDWQRGSVGKVNPPLRERSDCEALWEGITSGVIDTIATDHVHRPIAAKEGGIWKASPGGPGMESMLPVMLSEGYHKRGIPISRIVSLLCEKPARAMGLGDRKGAIAPGYDADFAIVDLGRSHRPSDATALSSAGYTIYDGWELRGTVTDTIVRGRRVFADGKLVEDAVGTGQYLRRSLG